MKYISFNINGIRATLKTDNLHKLINDYNPDFICFQEVKATLHEVNPTSIELFNFIDLITDKEGKSIKLNSEDEIVKASLITNDGKVLFGVS